LYEYFLLIGEFKWSHCPHFDHLKREPLAWITEL